MTSNDRHINSIYLEYTPYEEYIPPITLKRTHSYDKKSQNIFGIKKLNRGNNAFYTLKIQSRL